MMTDQNTHPWHPQPYRLVEVQQESGDVFTWTLRPVNGEIAPSLPGQFNMLYQFGHGEVAISLSGDPTYDAGHNQVTHTLRAVGAVTRTMASVKQNDVIGLRGPFGKGWPVHEIRGSDLMIIAGGLGIAPLRSLIHWVIRRRPEFGHVYILYGARSPSELIYTRELAHWAGHVNIEVLLTVDNADSGWQDHIGTVTELIPLTRLNPQTTTALVCGPEIMMRFTLMALQLHGLASDAIYLSMERHMQCAVGYCGHCLYGRHFICREGPVFRHDNIADHLLVKAL